MKLQKLLFLVSAVNASDEDLGLLNIFDKFYAMQYGPVELDIYSAMVNDGFKNLKFDKIKIIHGREEIMNMQCDNESLNTIKKSVEALKNINKYIINYSATQLINITHKWDCWNNAMEYAHFCNKNSEIINNADIVKDTNKYYE